jgi:hypothetical protein
MRRVTSAELATVRAAHFARIERDRPLPFVVVDDVESTACPKHDACVLQKNHAGPCSASFDGEEVLDDDDRPQDDEPEDDFDSRMEDMRERAALRWEEDR